MEILFLDHKMQLHILIIITFILNLFKTFFQYFLCKIIKQIFCKQTAKEKFIEF